MSKDKLTNICGIVIVLSGALIAADKAGQVNLGNGIGGALSIILTIATALIGYMTGKPNTPQSPTK